MMLDITGYPRLACMLCYMTLVVTHGQENQETNTQHVQVVQEVSIESTDLLLYCKINCKYVYLLSSILL
jgi:hypothetical protein